MHLNVRNTCSSQRIDLKTSPYQWGCFINQIYKNYIWDNDNKNSAPVCANGKAYTLLKVTEQRRNAMLMGRVCLESSNIFLCMQHKFLGASIFWHVTQTWHVGMLRGHNVTKAPAGGRDLHVNVCATTLLFSLCSCNNKQQTKVPATFSSLGEKSNLALQSQALAPLHSVWQYTASDGISSSSPSNFIIFFFFDKVGYILFKAALKLKWTCYTHDLLHNRDTHT